MAHHAPLLDRRMDRFACLQQGLDGPMAGQAQIVALLEQQFGKVALMHVVTGWTTSSGDRRVNRHVLYNSFRVALKAQLRLRILEQSLFGRLMRIMAKRAIASHDRRVNDFFIVLCIVAHRAEIGSLLRKSNDLIIGMFCLLLRIVGNLVTGSAHPLLHRIVDNFAFSHIGVASRGNTAVFLSRGPASSSKQQEDPTERKNEQGYTFFH